MKFKLLAFVFLVTCCELKAAVYSLDLPVIWQQRPVANITFVLDNFTLQAVNTRSLSDGLKDIINEEVKLRIENYPSPDIEIEHLELMGIYLEMNARDLNVILELEPEALAVDELTYGDRNYLARPTDSARWAVLNNLNLRYDRNAQDQNEFSFEWLGDVNFGGHDGINGQFSIFYDKLAERSELYRGDIQLFYDKHTVPIRYELGDLSSFNQGHLASANLGGIGLSRAYRELQPLTKITPSNSQEFYLKQAAEVEVLVNGNIIARVRLAPGRYDLNDLPLTTGENDVQVLATYSNGEQEDFTFSTFYNAQLLEKGRSDFALSIGKPSSFSNFEFEYEGPVLATGFYEYGLTNYLTAGVTALYTDGQYLLGATSTIGTTYGNFTFRFTHSDTDSANGYAFSVDTEHTIWGGSQFGIPNLRISYDKRDDFNAAPWIENSAIATRENISFSYTYFISQQLDVNLTARRDKNQFSETRDSATAQLNWRYKGVRVSAEYRYQEQTSDELDESNVFINANWTIFKPQSRTRTRFDYTGRNDNLRASYTKVNRNYLNEFGYAVDLQRSPDNESASVSASYTGNRFRADVNSRYQNRDASGSSDDHRINLSTSIGIADGKVGIGQNIRAPFALVKKHETLANAIVLINPTPQGQALAEAEEGLAGLISLGAPFTDAALAIDAQGTPLGYDWGPGSYNIVGGSTTAHVVTVGSDLSYTVIGFLKDADNNPVNLQRGQVDGEGISNTFFTNRTGRFVLEGVGPGAYTLTIGKLKADIIIEAGETSLIRLGSIQLSEEN